MSKGVHNTHQAEIHVSLPDVGNLVLQPGDNRLTVEQHRALKAVPIIKNYFEHGLLRDVTLASEPVPAPAGDDGDDGSDSDDGEKPIDRMNKAELLAKAESLGLTVAPDATNAAIRDAIRAAL